MPDDAQINAICTHSSLDNTQDAYVGVKPRISDIERCLMVWPSTEQSLVCARALALSSPT